MTQLPEPKGLNNWLAILDDQLLPVLPSSARGLAQLLKDEDVSLHAIAEVVARDPVLRVHVIRECNRQYKDHAAGILSNPNHCVSMLGLDKMRILLRQFKAAKGDPNHAKDYRYFQAINTSLHAAEQAASWAQIRKQSTPDSLFLASLLYGVPTWCLWRFAHREMSIIYTLFQREQIPLIEAEQAVLGCSREDIALGLAERWHFPELIINALNSQQLPKPGFLLRSASAALRDPNYRIANRTPDGTLVNTPALAITLSNNLAQQTQRDWYSHQTLRLLKVIAAYLDLALEETESHCKNTAIQAAQKWYLAGTQSPANGLIWPVRPRQRRRIRNQQQLQQAVAKLRSNNKATPKVTTVSSDPAPKATKPELKNIGIHSENLPEGLDRNSILNAPKPQAPDKPLTQYAGFESYEKRQEFERLLQELNQQPDPFSSELKAIQFGVNALYRCSNLQRVVVAKLEKDENRVKAFYAQGCDDIPALKHFAVKLQPTNLFTQLLSKPAAVWMSPVRKTSVAGLVPGNFKLANQTDEYFLMSLFDYGGAYGVLYADRGLDSPVGLSDAEYKIFKKTCTSCSKYLITRSKPTDSKQPGEKP